MKQLEECERTEGQRTIYDAKMCARGNGLGIVQRPPRDGARCNSRDCQPGENAKGYVLRQLVRSLQVKSTPTFKGDGKEDPIQFMKKASDYMEASGIPDDDHWEEFKHCLKGKARVWYNEIDVPTDWDDLSEKFCQHFCIYGRALEDWYRQWNKMSFDPNLDNDIEDFIKEVKALQSLLSLLNKLVVTTLKEKFPSNQLHSINLDTVVDMYDMLRAMFPKIRVTVSTANLFFLLI